MVVNVRELTGVVCAAGVIVLNGAGMVRAQAIDNPFLNKPRAGWFEVVAVRPVSERPSHVPGVQIRRVDADVRVQQALPQELAPPLLTLAVERAEGVEGGELGLQNWFPLHAGEAFVAAFGNDTPHEASQLSVLQIGAAADAWQACVTFFQQIASRPAAERAPALVKLLQGGGQINELFFRLLFSADRHVYAVEDVSRAFSAYLRDPANPLALRARVITSYLDVPDELSTTVRTSLASSVAAVIIAAHAGGRRDDTQTLLARLCGVVLPPQGQQRGAPLHLENGQLADGLRAVLSDRTLAVSSDVTQCLTQRISGVEGSALRQEQGS